MNKFTPILILLASLMFNPESHAIAEKNLPIGLTPQEKLIYDDYLSHPDREITTDAPVGPIHSLGEWEQADAVMTLWNNSSLLKALSENGNVKILAEDSYDQDSWLRTLKSYNLDTSRFSFYLVRTNSMWVRDYGPWWIVDGSGKIGIVDTIYNRPRPLDDVVPDFIGKELGVPVYKPGLVHTGGNYYSDGLGNAFSSTLPFKENSKFSAQTVINKMLEFLGIEKYTTSSLGADITIEHLDTFGKLVAPDTWVFSEFDKDSDFYSDAENMVKLIKTQTSPYGTPYKVYRLKMVRFRDGNYRAYLNSFISNGALYFPAYKDSEDDTVKAIYQAALPGYKVIGVDAKNTEWGDSVHCRTRNLITRNTIFIFPRVVMPKNNNDDLTITAEIDPAPNAQIQTAEVVFLENGREVTREPMENISGNNYVVKKHFAKGEKVDFYINATDSSGKVKTHPINAPQMTINFTIL